MPPSRSPLRCAEALLELEPGPQADLVLSLEPRFARLVARTLNVMLNGAEIIEPATRQRGDLAVHLLQIWTGIHDHVLRMGDVSSMRSPASEPVTESERAVARVKRARVAAIGG